MLFEMEKKVVVILSLCKQLGRFVVMVYYGTTSKVVHVLSKVQPM